MLLSALALFALAAVGGAVLLWMHLQYDDAPLSLAATHGILGAAGLVVLLWMVFQSGATGLLGASVVLFVLAALGGFALIAKHLRGESLAAGLMYSHGGLAMIAFGLLVVVYLG